ncbi:hypothetical protein [Clostridium sp. D43t1_170807_H7]|uniref:hypothetical protein n=1 Tax=Clostridium sp. D43t1_170807_H7 TaxID=2787140 RepID=UPI00189874DC|nr:hypothetical protein [Clostridium sp. D43t1_170807_H7]
MSLEKLIEDALDNKEVVNKNTVKAQEVKYEIVKELVKIEVSKNWDIVMGLVKWGDKDPKYEIRRWKKDGTAGKGVTFTENQLKEFIKIIKETDFNL